jgi:SAM-dependent methyltransferase
VLTGFERRYRADADPWRTLSDPYEQTKIQRALAACGPGPFASACELGAGVGALTALLAPRCARLLALDGAPTAVAAARERLARHPSAWARVALLPRDLPRGSFDLVVASEVLYYLGGRELDEVAVWIEGALPPGGRAVAVHWTGAAPDMRTTAGDVSAALAARPGLALRHEDFAGFRIDVAEPRR